MKPAFREITPAGETVTFTFNGQPLQAAPGQTLAAALLLAGVGPFRHTPVSGAPRAAFCMMGACYDCLVEIDGLTTQACMTEICEGLEVSMPRNDGGRDD